MVVWMLEWTDRKMDWQMDRLIDDQVAIWRDGWMGRQKSDGWKDRQTDQQTVIQTDRLTTQTRYISF